MPGMPNLNATYVYTGSCETWHAQALVESRHSRHAWHACRSKESIKIRPAPIGAGIPLGLFTALIARIIDTPAPVGRVQYKSSEIPGGTTLAGTG